MRGLARNRPFGKYLARPVLAVLGRIAMKDQVCDQGLETVRANSRDRASREADPQVAEQVDPHGY